MRARSSRGWLQRRLAAIVVGLLLLSSPAHAAGIGPVQGGALPGPLPLFPADNWWNVDVSSAPVDPGSASFISFINNGGTRRLHPDFGGEVSPGSAQSYGMPYAVVDGTQPKMTVQFVAYPGRERRRRPGRALLSRSPTRPSPSRTGSRAAIRATSTCAAARTATCSSSTATTSCSTSSTTCTTTPRRASGRRTRGAFFDMKTNDRRPEGWTSADAAGPRHPARPRALRRGL